MNVSETSQYIHKLISSKMYALRQKKVKHHASDFIHSLYIFEKNFPKARINEI